MPIHAERSKHGAPWLVRLSLTAGVGLAAGLAVFLLTLVLSSSDIGGPGWSLRGNGALIVLFAGGPALLAAGWLWLADQSLPRALLAGAITLALALSIGFAPIVLFLFASSGALVSAALMATALVLALAAGVVMAGRLGRLPGVLILAVALVLTLAVSSAAYLFEPLLLPLVLATPTLARRWSAQLGAECSVLLLAMLLGDFGGQYVFRPA